MGSYYRTQNVPPVVIIPADVLQKLAMLLQVTQWVNIRPERVR